MPFPLLTLFAYKAAAMKGWSFILALTHDVCGSLRECIKFNAHTNLEGDSLDSIWKCGFHQNQNLHSDQKQLQKSEGPNCTL